MFNGRVTSKTPYEVARKNLLRRIEIVNTYPNPGVLRVIVDNARLLMAGARIRKYPNGKRGMLMEIDRRLKRLSHNEELCNDQDCIYGCRH